MVAQNSPYGSQAADQKNKSRMPNILIRKSNNKQPSKSSGVWPCNLAVSVVIFGVINIQSKSPCISENW